MIPALPVTVPVDRESVPPVNESVPVVIYSAPVSVVVALSLNVPEIEEVPVIAALLIGVAAPRAECGAKNATAETIAPVIQRRIERSFMGGWD